MRRNVWQRLARIARHRWWDERDAARALPPAALQRIEALVGGSERGHSGEIRVVIEAGLPLSYLWKDLSARDRAITLFGKLRVWDTEANNGVLIYLLLAEHAIEIVADRGIDRHVDAAQWRALIDPMRAAFRAGRFGDGLGEAIQTIDGLLRTHFPVAPGEANPNELPDRPLVQ
ncbi:MAG TPA: TPM domain-containing protein [Aquabacterium sp.]|nr:TPM domain-containing protein [Aquabacterium sp.]HQC97235.1 TPM domain-containing protein [Aquabacterium sp.]